MLTLLLLACASSEGTSSEGTSPSLTSPGSAAAVSSDLPTALPDPGCQALHSPFLDEDRRSFAALRARASSNFGAHRTSYVSGHKHAGVDLDTRFGQQVHGLCAGRVVDIHLGSPHRTVVVEHQLPDGSTRYASYKHLEDLQVRVGSRVDQHTVIGRVFTEAEQAAAPWRKNHLHFELRHDISDEGSASWTAMSMEELQRYAEDPLPFFQRWMED